jgi:fatty acid amide hydrolase
MTGEPIVRWTAVELAERLSRREVSSLEVVHAYLARIEATDAAVHAFTHVFRERAIAEAAERDAERARGNPRGTLHGIPITVKENFDLAGHPTTLGLRKRLAKNAARDAALVRVAREQGAILLGRTNVPQTLLSFECRNPVYGQTSNPFSSAHAPGGSSGGECAAIATAMSPFGLGTDIGGSIRIPSHCSGVVGFKPTLDRLTNLGLGTALLGQEGIRAQSGPMARNVGDLVLLMRALDPARMAALDPRVPPLPFTNPHEIDVAKLCIGVYADDGVMPPSPACVRATERAAAVLRAAGASVAAFVPPRVPDAIALYFSALAADGGTTLREALSGEDVDVALRSLVRLSRLPNPARRALAAALSFRGEKRIAHIARAMGSRTVDGYWRLIYELRAYRQEVFDAMAAAGVDVLLSPAMGVPAVPHGLSANFAIAASYTMLYNLLQFPAGVVPVTTVRAAETAARPAARDSIERRAVEVDAASAGLPVGVQVAARPFADEVAIAVMAAIERGVCQDEGFPATPIDPRGA